MNKVQLVGNLTKDVDLSTTTSGISVAKFTLAVQRKYKNENGEYITDFINCVAWRNQADNLSKYCHKGDKVAVVGTIQTRTYDATDGTKRYVTEIVAEEVEFINTKKETKVEEKEPELIPIDDDGLGGLPF